MYPFLESDWILFSSKTGNHTKWCENLENEIWDLTQENLENQAYSLAAGLEETVQTKTGKQSTVKKDFQGEKNEYEHLKSII